MADINSSEIIGRIRFLIDTMGMSQGQFARRLGIDPANISKHLNGRLPITKGLVNRIAADMGVSKHWLAYGEGVPFPKSEDVEGGGCGRLTGEEGCSPYPRISDNAIPVYDIDVTAGNRELSREFTSDRIIGYVNIPEVRRGTSVVRVNGDSMMPSICDGAFVAIRPVTDVSCIFWGQIYVVVLDDFRVVKHVRRHPDPSMVILRSENPLYDDMEIARSKIRKLYIVESILNVKIQC